jgi:TIR domain
MTPCEDEFKRILRKIRLGTTRFRSETAARLIMARINRYASRCDAIGAEFLSIFLEHTFGLARVPECVARLKNLLVRASPQAALESYQLLAKMTLLTEPLEANIEYRLKALELARKVGFPGEDFTILVNWLNALIKVHEYASAHALLPAVKKSLGGLNKRTARSAEIYVAHSRLLTHEAKLAFWQAVRSEPEEAQRLVAAGNELYREALRRDKTNDHRRVNEQIEWAQELIHLSRSGVVSVTGLAEELLEVAERSLDTHVCPACPAYFSEVKAESLLLRGDKEYWTNREAGISRWQACRRYADRGIELFRQYGFAEIGDMLRIVEEVDRRLEMADRPRRVFLSHRATDKDLVREFRDVLRVLKFEPWLDDDAMHAGVPLEEALLEGLKGSCAAVFFITPSFKESSYLDSEIRYALMEWRKRPKDFTIIPLVFRDNDGREGSVPPLLQQFVYKKPVSHLDALKELVLALPLDPTTPEWKIS